MLDKKQLKYLVLASLSLPCLQVNTAYASSVNVIHDVPNKFLYMENAAADIKAYKTAVQDLEQAKLDARQAAADLEQARSDQTTAQRSLQDAEAAVKAATANLQQARTQLEQAKSLSAEKTRAAIVSQQAEADYAPNVYAARSTVSDLQNQVSQAEAQRPAPPVRQTAAQGGADSALADKIQSALADVDYAAEYLSSIEDEINAEKAGSTGDSENAADEAENEAEQEAYDARLDDLNQQLDDASQQMDDVQSEFDALTDEREQAEAEEADAREAVADLENDTRAAAQDLAESQKDKTEAEAYLAEAEKNLLQAETGYKEAKKNEQTAQDSLTYWGEGRTAAAGAEFYSWHGAESGHQVYVPYNFSSSDRHHAIDLSLSTGYVSSDTGKTDGHVSGWTDTALSVTKLNDHAKYDVRYHLDINVPTGQSKIYDNAVVPDDLAMFTRFGEGWNWTPGIEVRKHLNDTDSFSVKTSYSLRGSYEYSKNVPDASIDPGNTWSTELSYLHAEENEKLMARLFFTTHTGKTDENGLKYKEGNDFGAEVYYEKAVSAQNSMEIYAGLSYTGASDYDVLNEEPNSGIHRTYFGLGLMHKIDAKRTFRILGNYVRSDGYTYDPLRNTYMDNRRRLSLLAVYEEKLNQQDNISLALEHYSLQEDNSSGYHGWGAAFMWNHNF